MDASVPTPRASSPSVDVLGTLLRRWKTIAAGTIAVTLLAAVASLLLPKIYRAEAALLINPLYKTTALEQAPLSVDTYEQILRIPPLIEEVRVRAGLTEMTVEGLSRRMTVTTVRRPSQRETTYAPILLLRVEDENPELCEKIANTWADLATSASMRIKGDALRQTNERIRKQFADTTRTLEAREDELKRFDTTAQLIERTAELEMLRTELATEQDNLETLRLDLGVAQTRLDDLKRKYTSFFVNGVWVGTLHESDNGTSAVLGGAKVEPLPQQFLDARNDLVRKTQRFTNYKIKERVDVTKRQYDILINKIIRFEQDIEDMRLSLATQKAKLHELEATSKTIPERLTVAKAPTDEALWSAMANRSLDQLAGKRLVSEEINPLWLSTQGRIQYLKPEIASIEARKEGHEKLLEDLRGEQNKLDQVGVGQTQDTQNLEMEMRLAKDRYETLFQVFLRISHDIMYQEGVVARLRTETTNGEKQVARLTSATMDLVNYTVAKDLERERLQRELGRVRNIYTALATRYEEARITELEVSGDLQIIFRAVKPEEKVRPQRSAIVGSAFLAALILFSLLAVAREHLRPQV